MINPSIGTVYKYSTCRFVGSIKSIDGGFYEGFGGEGNLGGLQYFEVRFGYA